MDIVDQEILHILHRNARSTLSSIAKKINLSTPAVGERIAKLERQGVLEKYTIKINRKQIQLPLTAFVLVRLTPTADIILFRKKISGIPNVLECHHVAGSYDYLLKIVVRDTADLENFLMNQLKKIEGVAVSSTFISLSAIKEEMNPKIGGEESESGLISESYDE